MSKITGKTVNGQPATDWNKVYGECAKHEQFVIEITAYDPDKEITKNQMAYFHAVIIPMFVESTGDSPQYWENKLKVECGTKWFKPEEINIGGHTYCFIPSKKTLSKTDFSEWYQNITDYGLTVGVVVPPPNPEWRKELTNVVHDKRA